MIQLAIIIFMFMAAVDTSVLATITPHIIAAVGDMHLYPVMNAAFLLAFVVATPVCGAVADHFGCKRASYLTLSIFLFGSLLAGFSQTMQQLILFRFIQGLGAGGLVNVCFITIAKIYHSDSKRSLMQAALSSVWAVAAIVGPLLGAYLTLTVTWRAVFWLNIPLGLIAGSLLLRFHEAHDELEEPFDMVGFLLFASASLLTFTSSSFIADSGFHLLQALIFVVGTLFFILFARRSLQISSPLIPLRLLKNKVILSCVVLGFLSGACLTCASTLISLYLQGASHVGLRETGFVIASMSIGWAVGSFICGLLLHKIGLRYVSIVATCFLITGFCLFSAASITYPIQYFLISSLIIGGGMGAVVNSTLTGVMRAAHRKMVGRATSFLSLIRSIGMSVGASLSGFLQLALFRSLLSRAERDGLPEATGALFLEFPEKILESDFIQTLPPSVASLVSEIFGESIETVFLWPVIILLLALPLGLYIPATKEEYDVPSV